jgi:hypothetical protein
LGYLGLSWSPLGTLGPMSERSGGGVTLGYFGLPHLSWVIFGYIGLFWASLGYLGLP